MSTPAIDAEFRETGRALVVQDEPPSSLFASMRPKERIALATEMADVLKDVLEKKGLIVRIPGKNGAVSVHVKAEGWQTCGALCGVSARIVSTSKTENGYEAKAEAVRLENGVVVGGGEAVCTKDEKRWSYADEYAVKSMAQTRAISKALRGVLAWVIVLAGYSPTPAEEVPPGGFADGKASKPAREPKPEYPTNEQTAELVALAKAKNVTSLRLWLVAHVAADFEARERKVLTLAEHEKAMALLKDVAAVAVEAVAPSADRSQSEAAPDAATSAATEDERRKALYADMHRMCRENGLDDGWRKLALRRKHGSLYEGVKVGAESATRLSLPQLEAFVKDLSVIVGARAGKAQAKDA